MSQGPLIILSGPTASGKSTVIARLIEKSGLPLHLSVSATTRPPRPGERDGVHYYFWPIERFQAAIANGEFLEWAQVHGNYYGTLKREVESYRDRDMGVILDIDVQGAAQVRKLCPDAVTVFLRTSSPETYEKRIRARNTEDEATIQSRLATAGRELERMGEYQFQVINDDLDKAVADFKEIARGSFRHRKEL